jgi:erythromycin esterase-like protein
VQGLSRPLQTDADLDPVVDQIGDARYVLIGEASHGTSEFYTWRARLSRRLIEEKGFSFVSVEGDWPDCCKVNRYVKGYPDAGNRAYDVLHAFARWPTWMWANWEMVAFCEWLRNHNAHEPVNRKAGFYGLDVYSLWESMDTIIDYLEQVDPAAAATAREAYICFEPYGEDAQSYALNTTLVPSSCEDEVVDLLMEVRQRAPLYDHDSEGAFNAEQNALVMVNAERYYRAMMGRGPDSWNIRDRHMLATLARLMDYHGPESKGIVWAHNTHVGDARATDMARAGMVNIGQLARENYRDDGVYLVGFGANRGSVIAGKSWGAPMERMAVPDSIPDSWESVLHHADGEDRLLLLDSVRNADAFVRLRGHRAIGVVYHPEREWGNFVPTSLPRRYDAFLYIDETEALNPLHLIPEDGGKPPETYPWGL